MTVTAIIAAGGSGKRFGNQIPKQFMTVAGLPLILHTLRAFERANSIQNVIAVLPKNDLARLSMTTLEEAGIHKVTKIIPGGATRQESVLNGLEAVDTSPDLVAIHDAARCLITPDLIERAVDSCTGNWVGSIVALPIRDTLKRVWGTKIQSTESRETLWGMQTPQVFRYPFIRDAYRKASDEQFEATDDAAVAERMGAEICVVEGSLRNLKVTLPEDIELAERFLQPARQGVSRVKIGSGIDLHPFMKGRPLYLGGMEIPSNRGLKGHSDADALIHAICDALLGALAMGDMGKHFSDADPRYKGKSSSYFLEKVRELVTQEGWVISHVDTTVVTEEPMLSPHIESMRKKISEILQIDMSSVSVKATRPEGLGMLGRKEGLMALAATVLTR